VPGRRASFLLTLLLSRVRAVRTEAGAALFAAVCLISARFMEELATMRALVVFTQHIVSHLKPHCSKKRFKPPGEQVVDRESGEVVEAYNPVPCRHCRGDDKPPYMSDDELAEWMASVRWIHAVTMPKHPHEYCLRREQDEETFLRVVKTIWDKGFDRSYLRRPWRSLDVGNYYIWVHTQPEPGMEAPLSETVLINRAERLQEKLA
jgi:hypothetical protein